MNKTVEQEILSFVETVNCEYHNQTEDNDEIPLVFSSNGFYQIIELDLETDLFCSEDDNLKDGIENIDILIKKLISLKQVLDKEYSKLSDEQLECFGVYKDEN